MANSARKRYHHFLYPSGGSSGGWYGSCARTRTSTKNFWTRAGKDRPLFCLPGVLYSPSPFTKWAVFNGSKPVEHDPRYDLRIMEKKPGYHMPCWHCLFLVLVGLHPKACTFRFAPGGMYHQVCTRRHVSRIR